MNSLIISVIFLFSTQLVDSRDHFDWSGEKLLHQDYLFKWKTNAINKSITFSVEVMTKGWVGFGLSKHGKTNEADMVYGWVDGQGKSTFKVIFIQLFKISYKQTSTKF